MFYIGIGFVGELFHTHNAISSGNVSFKDDVGCGVTHHHTTYQKDDCLACVRTSNPQSFTSSFTVRCFDEIEFVSFEHSHQFLQPQFSFFESRGPPTVNS